MISKSTLNRNRNYTQLAEAELNYAKEQIKLYQNQAKPYHHDKSLRALSGKIENRLEKLCTTTFK